MENIDELCPLVDDLLEEIFEESSICPNFTKMKDSFFKGDEIDNIFTEKNLTDGEILTLFATDFIFIEKGELTNSKSELLHFEKGDFLTPTTLQILGYTELPIHFLSSATSKIFHTNAEILQSITKHDTEMPAGYTAFKKVMKHINGEGANCSISSEFNNFLKKIKKQL